MALIWERPPEYLIEIDSNGTTDTFRWSIDGGANFNESMVSIPADDCLIPSVRELPLPLMTRPPTSRETAGGSRPIRTMRLWRSSVMGILPAPRRHQTRADPCNQPGKQSGQVGYPGRGFVYHR